MKITKRIGVLLAVMALIGAVLPASVAAEIGLCQDYGLASHYFAGNINSSPSVTRTGAQAYIQVNNSSAFRSCGPGGNGEPFPHHNGAFAWVGVQPRNATDPNAIVQIGVGSCYDDAIDGNACATNKDDLIFWWADGGCGNGPVANYISLADASNHLLTVSGHDAGWLTSFRLKIDGVVKQTISKSDSRISCWSGGLNQADWLSERWDRGDSTGTTPTWPTNVTLASYLAGNSGTWVNPRFDLIDGINCTYPFQPANYPGIGFCDETGQQSFTLRTQQ